MTSIFADGANLRDIYELNQNALISGFTTNPTLMHKAGVRDYEKFAKEAIEIIGNKSFSLEVFSDDLKEMKLQALKISSWGSEIYVKIPVTNTVKKGTEDLVRELNSEGIKVNVTAVMSLRQVSNICEALSPNIQNYVSIFAGRIADTGRDPIPLMQDSLTMISQLKNTKLIWASPREVLNFYQAEYIGCHIITMTEDLLRKLNLRDYNLEDYSLDTVKMFRQDAISAGFKV